MAAQHPPRGPERTRGRTGLRDALPSSRDKKNREGEEQLTPTADPTLCLFPSHTGGRHRLCLFLSTVLLSQKSLLISWKAPEVVPLSISNPHNQSRCSPPSLAAALARASPSKLEKTSHIVAAVAENLARETCICSLDTSNPFSLQIETQVSKSFPPSSSILAFRPSFL